MPRLLALVVALLALIGGAVAPAVAQDATPVASATFADTMGLLELAVTVTDTAIEGLPAETPAGRYLVTVTSAGTEPGAVGFIQLPEGKTVADLAVPAEAAPPGPDATPGPGMAETPMAGMETEGTPAAEGGNPFAWVYETYIAGGAGAPPGGTAQVIVDLKPGNYAAWAEDPEAPQAPVALTVTGDMPTDLPEPSADVTVTATGTNEGYDLEYAGEFAPGPQTVQFVNDSDQPHFLIFIRSPGPITMEQVQTLLTFDPTTGATPPPGMPNPEEFQDAAFAGTISEDATEWLATNLEPGYYIVACFIPDAENPEVPHAAQGLIDVITVGDVGTPTP